MYIVNALCVVGKRTKPFISILVLVKRKQQIQCTKNMKRREVLCVKLMNYSYFTALGPMWPMLPLRPLAYNDMTFYHTCNAELRTPYLRERFR
jgi:hypothetical protein